MNIDILVGIITLNCILIATILSLEDIKDLYKHLKRNTFQIFCLSIIWIILMMFVFALGFCLFKQTFLRFS
jgi:hypothetical protein